MEWGVVITTVALVVVLLAVLVVFVLRPQRRREGELRRMRAELGPGSRVLLASGVFATVVRLRAHVATVSIAERVEIDVLRSMIVEVDPDHDPQRRRK